MLLLWECVCQYGSRCVSQCQLTWLLCHHSESPPSPLSAAVPRSPDLLAVEGHVTSRTEEKLWQPSLVSAFLISPLFTLPVFQDRTLKLNEIWQNRKFISLDWGWLEKHQTHLWLRAEVVPLFPAVLSLLECPGRSFLVSTLDPASPHSSSNVRGQPWRHCCGSWLWVNCVAWHWNAWVLNVKCWNSASGPFRWDFSAHL